jgi:propanediol dehydratase large subunit
LAIYAARRSRRAAFTDDHVERAIDAAGSKDPGETGTLAVLTAARSIRGRGLTVVDIVTTLDECGYPDLAQRTVAFLQARLHGDHADVRDPPGTRRR